MLHLPCRQEPPHQHKRGEPLLSLRTSPRTGISNCGVRPARANSKTGKKFSEAAERFLHEYPIITAGERSEPQYVATKEAKLRVHLLPFFGTKVLSEITPGTGPGIPYPPRMQDIGRTGKPPARSTMHQEIVTLRQVLKTAMRHGWLEYLPDLSAPYKASGKITHRAWFSPDEYRKLYEATRERAQRIRPKRNGSGLRAAARLRAVHGQHRLRPDEATRLEFRDVNDRRGRRYRRNDP